MNRLGPAGRAVCAALSIAVLLVACSPPSGPRTSSSRASTASPSSAAAAPTSSALAATASPPASAQTEWKTFTTSDGQLMFDYPPDWTIKDRVREAAPGGIFVEVLNGAGKPMAALRTNIVAGPQCTEKHPYSLMDSEDLPALAQKGAAPRFVFEGRAESGTGASKPEPLAYGITSAPLPTGRTACPIFHFFTWPPGVATFGGVYDPLNSANATTPNVDNPEAYTGTDEYDDIRQTITSLRPADE